MFTRFRSASLLRAALLAALLLPAGLALAQRDPCLESKAPECKPIQQKRCRDAAEQYIAHIKTLPLDKPKEVEESKRVIAKMEPRRRRRLRHLGRDREDRRRAVSLRRACARPA
jgi:hypothetical protein